MQFLIFHYVFTTIGFKNLKKILNKIIKLKKLSKKDILIKNLEYDVIGNTIKVVYTTKEGVKISLSNDIEENSESLMHNEDKKADLLIDPDDYTNYYINLEIY